MPESKFRHSFMDTFIPSRTSMNACPVRTWGSGNEEGEPRLSAGGDHLSMEAPRELALTAAAPGWGTSGQGRYRTPPPCNLVQGGWARRANTAWPSGGSHAGPRGNPQDAFYTGRVCTQGSGSHIIRHPKGLRHRTGLQWAWLRCSW